MTGPNLVLAMPERQLRAGARVLGAILNHEHPMVQRVVTEALVDHGKHEALGCLSRMYGALLAEPQPSRWDRLRGRWHRFVEKYIVADDPWERHEREERRS